MTPIGLYRRRRSICGPRLGLPPDDVAHWIEAGNEAGIYLNRLAVAAHGTRLDARWPRGWPYGSRATGHPGRVHTGGDCAGEIPANDDIGRRVKKSFYAGPQRDVLLWRAVPRSFGGSRPHVTPATPHP